MPAVAAIGAQWGDEGKGKIVDLLARKSDVVVRFSGGDNAGHTVVNTFGEFKLHLVPSGIFSKATCIMGNGMAINPAVLISEMDSLNKSGVSTDSLFISDRAHLIMPYHILLDGLEEDARGGGAVGTTRKGIGPVYADKVARLGIRAGDLLERKVFLDRLKVILDCKNKILTGVYNVKPLSLNTIYDQYCRFAERLVPHIRDTALMLDEALRRGENILLEGAQGTLLDPDYGTYPYTTSSPPISAGACLGSGLAPNKLSGILGVFKAYCTRVGNGPMPTELNDSVSDLIRERGHEYGTTTGRLRRCGWFDAVVSKFSTRTNGFTSIALTRLDILDTLPKLNICLAYELDGKQITEFPSSITALERCKPIYEELPGWQCPTTEARSYKDLPLEARQYVARIEQLSEAPVNLISVGHRIDQTIEYKPAF